MTNISEKISNVSKFFTDRYRITLLLFIGIIALGFASYTSFLDREGFPAVQFPIGTVNVIYDAESTEELNRDVTEPIETELADVTEITQIQSTTTDRNVSFVLQFRQDFTSEEGIELVQEELSDPSLIPDEAEISFNSINAASSDGQNDFIFSIFSENNDLDELIATASELSEDLEGLGTVVDAEVKSQFREITNPRSGETEEVRTAFYRVGNKEGDDLEFYSAAQIGIQKSPNADSIQLSNSIRDEVSSFLEAENLTEELSVSYGGDQAETVNDQINSLEANALSGFLIIIVVLFLFVNWRASIVTGLFMPLVLGATFLGIYLLGGTLNTISLFGLILVLGLFVDDAIVVVESIFSYKRQGYSGSEAIKEAVGKIATADISGTLTTMLVFVPMLFISGILGEFIREIPTTVILALIMSVTIALTIIPFLANVFINSTTEIKKTPIYYLFNGFAEAVSWLGEKISAFVELYLSSKLATAGVVFASIAILLAAVIPFGSQLEFSIFPPSEDSDSINLNISYDDGVDITRAQEVAEEIETELRMREYEKNIEQVNYFSANSRSATIQLELTPMEQREIKSPELADNLAEEYKDLEDAEVSLSVGGAGPPATEFPFQVQILSSNQDALEAAADAIEEELRAEEFESPQGDETFEVSEVQISNLESIAKRDGERFVNVQAKFTKDELNTGELQLVQNRIDNEFDEERLEELGLNPDDGLQFDQGVQSDNAESFDSTIFAFGVALLLMYMLLVIQFNSFTQPLLVFVALPFTAIGIVPGLVLTGNALSFFVMIGVIALSGIAVNNTIILMDFANQARDEGKGIRESIAEAVRLRFRPLLATTVTTVASLIPLAISDPFWEALAFTIIFGLIASTLTVIFAFPSFYAILEKIRVKRDEYLPALK